MWALDRNVPLAKLGCEVGLEAHLNVVHMATGFQDHRIITFLKKIIHAYPALIFILHLFYPVFVILFILFLKFLG